MSTAQRAQELREQYLTDLGVTVKEAPPPPPDTTPAIEGRGPLRSGYVPLSGEPSQAAPAGPPQASAAGGDDLRAKAMQAFEAKNAELRAKGEEEYEVNEDTIAAMMQRMQSSAPAAAPAPVGGVMPAMTPVRSSPSSPMPSMTPVRSSQSSPSFEQWYAQMAKEQGLNPNPDAPESNYDYRAAFKANARPDASGHWPSDFKKPGHPNMVVGGFNTQTGKPAPGATLETDVNKLVQQGWAPETAAQLVQSAPKPAAPARVDPMTQGWAAQPGARRPAQALPSAPNTTDYSSPAVQRELKKKAIEWLQAQGLKVTQASVENVMRRLSGGGE